MMFDFYDDLPLTERIRRDWNTTATVTYTGYVDYTECTQQCEKNYCSHGCKHDGYTERVLSLVKNFIESGAYLSYSLSDMENNPILSFSTAEKEVFYRLAKNHLA
jgi:hypothetical protein